MAELDDKLIQNLNQRLQTMESLLSNLTKTLGGVKEGMVSAFNPAIVKSWSDSIKGLKTIRLIDAEKAKTDIKEINDMVRVLTQEQKHGRVFTLFTEEEYNAAIKRLANLRVEIENLNRKAKSKEGLSEDEALIREALRQQRDSLYMATRRGGYLGEMLSPQQMAEVNDQLAKYKALQTDIAKGSERRAAELANLKRNEEINVLKQEAQLNKEIAEEEQKRTAEARQRYAEAQAANKAMNKEQDALEKRQRSTRVAESKSAWKADVAKQVQNEQKMNQAIQQQIQYYRQLHTLYKGYKDLQAKPNKTKEDIAILEQTKQKILEILRLSKQLELENKGSRQAGINATNFQRLADNLRNASKETKTLKANLNNLLPTLQRLASAFGVAFSVRGLAQFGKKLIETRGEFERQQVALRSILQNKQLADEIWDKTMQAALQSPFTAMQLTTYTKQLAAYRIETDKLFETTKRLADVSAGLGVDMQRLILAYGQVKAANFLRASEIRQFTEAGVNILGELSKYFSETRNQMYSTAQVMEMVTKRMVTFSDVEEIFKRMTDAGGIFYDMQYVQSQTVKGQINKLHDAYDQMLNNIGKANQGVLKDMVALLNNIVKNWREWKTVLDLIAWPVIIFSLRAFTRGLLSTAAAANLTTKQFTGLTCAGMKLQTTLKGLFATIKSHPWIALATAVASVVVAYRNHEKQIKAVQKEINEQNTRLYETELLLDGYQKKIEDNNKIIKDSAKGTKELTESQKDNKGILTTLQEQYPEIAKGLKLQADGTIVLTDVIKSYNDELERQITLSNILSKKSSSGGIGGIFSDTYKENLEQYTVSLSQIKGEILSAKHTARSIQTKMKAEGEEELPLFKMLNDIADIDMSDVEAAAEKYRKIRESLWGYITEGESEAGGVQRAEKIQGADKYGYELPILSELKMSADFAEEAIKDNRAIIESSFAESLNSIDEYSKAIANEYGGDVEAFISDNIEKINEGVKNGDADVVSTIRTVFEKNGGATTKEAKDFFNKILNYYLVFHDAREQIDALEAQAAAERSKKITQRNYELILSLEQQKQAILDSLSDKEFVDFFATSPKRDGNSNKPPFQGDKSKKSAPKLISLIREMRSEYDKLSKSAYGYAKSEEKVRESYKDSVKEILGDAGITDYDFTTNEGMMAALEKVKSFVQGSSKYAKDAWKDVQKYIDQLETEIEINAQVKIREDFVKDIEKAFNDYELTLELDKLNISPEAAKDLFPEFDSKTLGELQDAMQAFYEKQGASFDEEDLKAYKQWSDKIDSEILKSRKEKAKQYSKYLEKEYSERAKVEMQYAKDVAFVTANFNGEQQKNILKGIEDKYQKDINELTWKSFKESSFYVEMMDDLSSIPSDYMKIMLDKIEELLAHPETLSPRALKEAINARQKILEAQMDINSISVMRESLKEMRDAATDVGGKTWAQTKKRLDEEQTAQAEKLKGLEEEIRCYEELQGQLKGLEQHDEAVATANRALPEDVISMLENTDVDTLIGQYSDELDSLLVSEDAATSAEKDANAEIQARIEYLQRIIPLLESYRTSLNERAAYQATDAGENALFARNGGETSSSVGETINEYKKEADEVSNRLSELKKWQKAFKNFSDGMAKWKGAVADAITKVGAMGDAFYDTFDALGGETNVLTEGWKEFGDTMVQTITQALTLIPQLVAGFIAAGTSINAAMGLIGLVAEAVQLILVAVGAVAKLHDARYEREIEIQQEKIDDLQRAYDRLEKSIEKTFDTVSYIREYNQEVQNLNEQYEALANQIDAEKANKNVDKDKLQDYADKQQEIIDNLEEIKQQQIEVFGGIGKDGYRDAAQGFVDAWKSAFLETGDGLQGLQDHFDEFLNDWFVKQATMKYMTAKLEPLFTKIDEAVNPNGRQGAEVAWDELKEINELKELLFEEANDEMKKLAGIWGLGGEGSLSGLAAGIQGMTEEQANILEAYWNSVRGYTASIDMNVATIVGLLSNGVGSGGKGNIFGDPNVNTNPMLQQLSLIAANTQATHQLLQSVTKSGHSQGGYGIKVFAD